MSLKEVIQSTTKVVDEGISGKHASIKVKLTGKLPSIYGDELRLRQVFFNLLSNAIKFTPEDGTVTVTNRSNKENVIVSIEDNGVGIKKADIKNVMKKFIQVDGDKKNIGTGLGLPLTSELMKLHGGKFTLTSKYGEGTKATVTFPKERVIKRSFKAKKQQEVPPRKGKRQSGVATIH